MLFNSIHNYNENNGRSNDVITLSVKQFVIPISAWFLFLLQVYVRNLFTHIMHLFSIYNIHNFMYMFTFC